MITKIFAINLAESLKCWGPKLEWTDYVPTIHYNQFELVECNKGLQLCAGGCKHCVNITGSFVAKSCAGDEDQGLSILGMHQDGCKNITAKQNVRYTNWINRSLKQSKYSLVADFTQACRCSVDGCNGEQKSIIGRHPRKTNEINLNQVSMGNQIHADSELKMQKLLLVFIVMVGMKYIT